MVIHTDRLHRIAYATDASVYREMPYGVAYPENEEDIRELIRYAREKGISLIPRAGGTSIAGQVVGSGLVSVCTRVLGEDVAKVWVLSGMQRLHRVVQPHH